MARTPFNRPLRFKLTLSLELSTQDYVEMAQHQKNFEEALELLSKKYDGIKFDIQQMRQREHSTHRENTLSKQFSRIDKYSYEDL